MHRTAGAVVFFVHVLLFVLVVLPVFQMTRALHQLPMQRHRITEYSLTHGKIKAAEGNKVAMKRETHSNMAQDLPQQIANCRDLAEVKIFSHGRVDRDADAACGIAHTTVMVSGPNPRRVMMNDTRCSGNPASWQLGWLSS